MELNKLTDDELFDFALAARRASLPNAQTPSTAIRSDEDAEFALGLMAAAIRTPAPIRTQPDAIYTSDDVQKLVNILEAELRPLLIKRGHNLTPRVTPCV